MKRLTLILCLFCAPMPALFTSCAVTPATQATQVKTLAAVGASAKAGMDACTVLLKGGHLTVAEWQKVAAFYDNQFQPAFSLAVAAVQADLSSPASADVLSLAAQFAALVSTYTRS